MDCIYGAVWKCLLLLFQYAQLPIVLGMKSLTCVPAVRRIVCSALELSKCCRHFSLARIAHVAGYAFVSRTDCIYGAVWEMLVTFFPVRSAAYIFEVCKVLRACLPSVELSVAHWSYQNVVGISLSHESPMWRVMLLFLARIAYMAGYGNACNFFSSTLSWLYCFGYGKSCVRACRP